MNSIAFSPKYPDLNSPNLPWTKSRDSVGRIGSLTNFNPNKRSPAKFSVLHHTLLAINWKEKFVFGRLLGLKGLNPLLKAPTFYSVPRLAVSNDQSLLGTTFSPKTRRVSFSSFAFSCFICLSRLFATFFRICESFMHLLNLFWFTNLITVSMMVRGHEEQITGCVAVKDAKIAAIWDWVHSNGNFYLIAEETKCSCPKIFLQKNVAYSERIDYPELFILFILVFSIKKKYGLSKLYE